MNDVRHSPIPDEKALSATISSLRFSQAYYNSQRVDEPLMADTNRTLGTEIISHGAVETGACETYGQGQTILRIGNGGAGATGLLKVLSEDWLRSTTRAGKVEWKKNHSRNTQLALLHREIDVAFTYERDQEQLAESEGWSRSRGCAFHDHFCLAGPHNDPAGVKDCSSIGEALQEIARSRCTFHSRVDASATMWKEQELWSKSGTLRPWEGKKAWFKTSLLGPKDALIRAASAGAYLLTDRSTILHATMELKLDRIAVYFEPTSADDDLMNSCYMLTNPLATSTEAEAFVTYMASAQAQQIIADYGRRETGKPLFAPIEAGYARDSLLGGRPLHGRWTTEARL